ncbi:furin-like protease 1 isoform X1 [Bombyx mandarina]|uniref:furin n=1 Tax=Bombyx mandarina TaxID=7092 RepID=A0A6J2KTQ9_BOMMA|nr:furin-like protease 1 isoform X1 [Bombyx mandarina]XP_028043565.1 furin-like protease 1 isoform X1 [Bombyx mandarina]XP_028043566.1 furin-like protease 1 isoform X1 [Bombyx mandarina]XP_028043567.1 furin-like protease 1 isoform X1 [Bombyx mandarina]XP_028043568.1 furin-like protease 1 isoform X1 [Bombyx mandarina]XP_028043569.1 furin-like protease 1 isoform X1 [Bombyx mandarina]
MARGVLVLSILVSVLSHIETTLGHYTPTWAVHIPEGREVADAVARDHGFVNLGKIFDDHYHFHHRSLTKRSLTPAHEHHGRLEGDSRVRWAEQQKILSRKKRDFQIISTLYSTAETRTSEPSSSAASKRDADRKRELNTRIRGRTRSADLKFILNDPKWPHMWYLNRGGGLDMNVIPAWREGITGRGVVVTILDDGLETDHPDLVANYDPAASYDVNGLDPDPQPRYDVIDSNRHGTRCAGEVAATANNSLCAVGVAFGARVGGVRMLDGDVTDVVEARSLSLNPQHVDIYSASWGPDDDGKTVDGPGLLATRAFIEGVTKGRNGKGSIFVWASGNGGKEHDNCNCDGYTNSIWTLSISSATERGDVPWYSEKCSSTLAATYSSGAINENQVVTTDLHHSCTAGHTGTSASAPLAAGICALALQANRDLTWRDMQHIVVRTARPERLSLSGEWRINGVGRNVSHSFGYGLLDASGMVRLAKTWRTVPPQRRCELAAPRPHRMIPPRSAITLQLAVSSCPGVNYLEHVQARISLSAARRGDLRITLTSPAGTNVTLLAPRPHDSSHSGFNSWPFMSVHMWGENPLGEWQLEVTNEGRYMEAGTLTQWELIFYGTETPAQEQDVSPDTNSLGENSRVDTKPWTLSEPESIEEVRQNAIDDDLALVWHDSQTIREENPVGAGDVDTGQYAASAAGCATRAPQPPHTCIECAKGLHLYNGRCYSRCPDGTYANEISMERSSRRRNLTIFSEGSLSKRQDGSLKSSALEALDMEPYANSTKDPLICLPCHYTCATCAGPHDSQCVSCLDDAELFTSTDSVLKYYCYPKKVVSQISDVNWHYRLNVVLSLVLFCICFISLYFIISWTLKWFYGTNNYNSNIAYNKLSSDEKQQSASEVEEEIRLALKDYSESETEDDLNL